VSQPNDASLYEGLPPDATVNTITEDDGNPGWAFVTFSDGREATLPTETARSMPQTPQAPPAFDPVSGAVPPGSYGEPARLPDRGGPMGFGAAPPEAAPPTTPAGGAFWGEPEPGDPGAPLAPPGEQRKAVFGGFGGGAAGDPTAPPGPIGTLAETAATVGAGSSQFPADGGNAAIVQPATPGGFAPFSTTEGATRGADVTADSPEAMSARLGEAVQSDAEAAYTRDLAAYDASVGAKHLAAGQLMEHEAELQRQRREHELTQQEHARIIDGIEKNPIDEDGFWTSGPGRRGAAWVALALSGFLQGASRGANPMLNQMMGAFQNAQSSWMQNQRAERDSVLRRRTAAMGDERAAISSLDMQLNGIMTKYIQLQSDAAGVPPPPGLATYVAERQLKMAEKQNEIGRIVTERVQQTLQSEQRATPAQPALRRGDVVLRELGMDEKKIQSAYDPNDGNVPGLVTAASKLQSIRDELKAIRAKYEGSLPQQALFSYNTFGAAPFAGRLGSEAAQDQVRAKALLLEAQQMVKQGSGTTKYYDSNQERDDLIKTIDTGEPETTMLAIDTITQRANDATISAAQRYTRDPQGLINFVRESRGETRGVDPGDSPVVSRVLKRGAPGAASAPAPAASGGADAAAPLAPPSDGAPPPGTPAPPSGPGLATPTTASLRGTYRALRASRLNAPR
jgi:hypothetical protein